MQISRRTWLKTLVGVGVTFSGVAGIVTIRLLQDTRKEYIFSVVNTHLSYLKFSPETLDEFAIDLIEFNPTLSSPRSHIIAALGHRTSRYILGLSSDRYAFRLASYEERIAGLFLLSSDFFDNGSNIGKEVTYKSIADPYESPCSNPIANTKV